MTAPLVDRARQLLPSGADADRTWWFPALLVVLINYSPLAGGVVRLIAAIIAFVLIVLLSKRPGPAMCVLVAFLPFQFSLYPWLYKSGVPAEILRPAAAVKEALALSVVLAGFVAFTREGRRLDLIDKLVLGYLAGVTVYLLLPALLSDSSAPTAMSVRLLGWRTNAMFLVLFLGARHAPIGLVWRRRVVKTLSVTLGIMAAGAVVQFFWSEWWHDFMVQDLQVFRYNLQVLDLPLREVNRSKLYLTADPPRAGSFLLSPFEFSDIAIIGGAFAMERLTRTKGHLWALAGVGLAVGGILASHTRAGLLGLAVAGLTVLRPAPGRPMVGRVRIGLLLFTGVAVLTPNLLGTRFTGADGGAKSSSEHISEFSTGLSRIIDEPLGQGLGTAPNVGRRFTEDVTQSTVFISDNAILQVGQELGLVMMVLFVALLVAVIRALREAPADNPDDVLAAASCAALLGLLAAGMLHHVFLTAAVAWTVWALAGLGLARTVSPEDRRGQSVPSASAATG